MRRASLIDTAGVRANMHDGNAVKAGVVEICYRFALRPIVTLIAAPFLPRISFWFDSEAPYNWVGHMMSLYSKWPNVLILHDGYQPRDILF